MTRIDRLIRFGEDAIDYFLAKLQGVDRDRYFADRDIRSILDKTLNDIILCLVDVAEEGLKSKGRPVPETYRETVLACYEFLGEITLKIAPLVRHRNETIHQYLTVNWQNVVALRNRIPDLRVYIKEARRAFTEPE